MSIREALLRKKRSSGFIQIAFEIPTQCARLVLWNSARGHRGMPVGGVTCLHIRQVSKLDMRPSGRLCDCGRITS